MCRYRRQRGTGVHGNWMMRSRILDEQLTRIGCGGHHGFRAEGSPPTYQADPDVYKVIFEDANFRVIARA
jgi:hypothetical protein